MASYFILQLFWLSAHTITLSSLLTSSSCFFVLKCEGVRWRVMKLVVANPYCSEAAAKDAMEAVWDVCYNDTKPFDRAPWYSLWLVCQWKLGCRSTSLLKWLFFPIWFLVLMREHHRLLFSVENTTTSKGAFIMNCLHIQMIPEKHLLCGYLSMLHLYNLNYHYFWVDKFLYSIAFYVCIIADMFDVC